MLKVFIIIVLISLATCNETLESRLTRLEEKLKVVEAIKRIPGPPGMMGTCDNEVKLDIIRLGKFILENRENISTVWMMALTALCLVFMCILFAKNFLK